MPITTIEFCGRDMAEALAANSNNTVISVSDPDSNPPVLAEGFHDILRLRFFDVGPGVPGMPP
jgi:hypothetical protein